MTNLVRNGCLRVALAVTGVLGALLALASPASAQTTYEDPLGGASDDLLTNLVDWIKNKGVVLVVGGLTIGLIIGLLVKFGKRSAKAA